MEKCIISGEFWLRFGQSAGKHSQSRQSNSVFELYFLSLCFLSFADVLVPFDSSRLELSNDISNFDSSRLELSNDISNSFLRCEKVDHCRFRTFNWALQVLFFTGKTLSAYCSYGFKRMGNLSDKVWSWCSRKWYSRARPKPISDNVCTFSSSGQETVFCETQLFSYIISKALIISLSSLQVNYVQKNPKRSCGPIYFRKDIFKWLRMLQWIPMKSDISSPSSYS